MIWFKSIMSALAGLLFAMVGLDNVTNQERFTFGLLELRDGLELVPVILGLFAVAEMFDLWVKGGSLVGEAKNSSLSAKETQKQIFQGIFETLKRWWLVMRCSAIGTAMGLIPGLGSAPAAFVAYGHARQSSKTKETFGKGNIEGVIGPESANNAVGRWSPGINSSIWNTWQFIHGHPAGWAFHTGCRGPVQRCSLNMWTMCLS